MQSTPETKRPLIVGDKELLEQFGELAARMEARGYTPRNIGIGALGEYAIMLAWAMASVAVWFALAAAFKDQIFGSPDFSLPALLVLVLASALAPELISWMVWSLIAPSRMRGVAFGIYRKGYMLLPYCALEEPLRRGAFILGRGAPLLMVILVEACSIGIGSAELFLAGFLMALNVASCLVTAASVLYCKPADPGALYLDSPAIPHGAVAFERGVPPLGERPVAG